MKALFDPQGLTRYNPLETGNGVRGPMRGQLFTIGHSNHDGETFLGLLRAQGITLVVDVRSSPLATRLLRTRYPQRCLVKPDPGIYRQ